VSCLFETFMLKQWIFLAIFRVKAVLLKADYTLFIALSLSNLSETSPKIFTVATHITISQHHLIFVLDIFK